MDRSEKVAVLSKLYYLRNGAFERCAMRLLRLGYRDIDIVIPICEDSSKNGKYFAELRKMNVNFRYQDYRYSLDVQCCDGYAAPDNIYRIFPEFAMYILEPETMRTANIRSEYPTFLEEHSFFDVSSKGETSSDAADLIAFRGNTKYRVMLHRFHEPEVQKSPSDDSTCTEVSPETIEVCADRFHNHVVERKRLYQYQGGHRIELSKDLSQLDIILFQGWSKSRLTIKSRSLSVQNAEEVFLHVVHCWMRAKCYSDQFPANMLGYGLIAQNFADDQNSFEVFSDGIKYSISTKTDELVDFDSMDGHVFERFCAQILAYNGFSKVQVTQGSRDQGVDIIAYKDDIRYGIQCKCYSADIGNKAVQEVFAGKAYYNCDVAVVLTNRYFTKSAVELAQRNRVHLWDRRKLFDLIENCKDLLLGTSGA